MTISRRLAILESDWFHGYNHTVRPFFEGLSRSVYEMTDGFHYERFVGQASIGEAMTYLVRKPDARYLYLASHGQRTHVECPNGDKIRRPVLDEILREALEGKRLDGLYFASCLFGTRKTAELLWALDDKPRTSRLKWVAGYTEEIDWIESMSLDLMFWNALLTRDLEAETDNPVGRLQEVVEYLASHVAELMRSLQFHVYVRQSGSGEIVDLVRQALGSGPIAGASIASSGGTRAKRAPRAAIKR